MGDPPGREGGIGTGLPVRPRQGPGFGLDELVVTLNQTHKNARARVCRHTRSETGMLHRLARGFQQHPVLRIHRSCFIFADAEELRIEVGRVIEKRAPPTRRSTSRARLGLVELVRVPAIQGNLGDQIVATQQRLPEPVR
ncbi:hypothetical protein MSIMFI_05342 [Mycobacterium simulans]|nr:hypothetical protein MSIMFI_05342 [Mycobacterium simulans]